MLPFLEHYNIKKNKKKKKHIIFKTQDKYANTPIALWVFFFEAIYDVLHNDLGHRRQF